MNNKKKKAVFVLIVAIALIILIGVGSTFAYFSATIESENVINLTSIELELKLEDDTSLIKSNLIPSEERIVDLATRGKDEKGEFIRYKNGAFLAPYKETEDSTELITEGTACIDDNGYEICSIYTFTIINPSLTTNLPLYITLNPSITTFENLYFKVLDNNLDTVIEATQLIDNRYKTYNFNNPVTKVDSLKYETDSLTGEWIKKENFDELKLEPYVLTNLNKELPKTIDEKNLSQVTYHMILWINEIHDDQSQEDGGKLFAAKLNVSTGPDGKGITGVFGSAGTE